jgi:hypothetical protein
MRIAGGDVLVAAAGEVDEQDLVLRHRRRDLHRVGERVRGLERRDDAFGAAQSWNAASASSSVAETYSARPLSCSQACSGPTPG